jgi:uncharacterized membrane protein YphA (DoxX/SURF4 family)
MIGLALLMARCVLVAIFFRAALGKMSDLADFRSAVANYRLLPAAAVPAVALALPFAEAAAALLLAVGVLTGPVAALLALLLVIFAAAIAVNLARGRVFDCGCAGSAPRKIGWQHVAVNLTLAAVAAAIALAPPAGLSVWPGVHGPFSVTTSRADAIPVVLAAVLAVVTILVGRRAATLWRLLGPSQQRLTTASAVSHSGRK